MNREAVQAKSEMLIRRPVTEVFEAFVNPEITSKFWFSKGSSRLEAGKQVQWDWEMYHASVQVDVRAIEQNRRILISWDTPPTTVEWVFTPLGDDKTFVSITNTGFRGTDDEIVKQVIASRLYIRAGRG